MKFKKNLLLSLTFPLWLLAFASVGCTHQKQTGADSTALPQPLEVSFQGNRKLNISSYNHANTTLRRIYLDLPGKTLYCSCSFDPLRKQAGREGCSYTGDAEDREYKVHWEHVVPAARMGRNRTCWKEELCKRSSGKPYGGRSCCRKMDPLFRAMEADMHNLQPAIGRINIKRQDYPFGDVPGEERQFGACDMEISTELDLAEPPPEARGKIARSYLYMEHAYDIDLTASERERYLKWHRTYPPGPDEIRRDEAIRKIQGNSNPFIHGYMLSAH